MTAMVSIGWQRPSRPALDDALLEGEEDSKMISVIETRAKRRSERREQRLYFAVAFLLCLPVVAVGRVVDGFKGRSGEHAASLMAETNAKVSGMLGFVFMT